MTAPLFGQSSPLTVVKPAGKEPTLTLGGLLQVQADAGDRGDSRFTNDNDRFYLRQAGGDLFEKRLTYAAGLFNGNSVNNNFNDNDKLTAVGRLAVVPWQGKLFGQSATWSVGGNVFTADDSSVTLSADLGVDSTPATPDRDGIFAGERRGTGFDSQLVAGRFELWAEYLRTDFEPANNVPRPDFVADGGYVQASWFVIPQKLQLVAKQETFDPNGDAKEDETDATTLGVNYYLKGHDLKLMLNYLRVDAGSLDSQDKVIARLQVIF